MKRMLIISLVLVLLLCASAYSVPRSSDRAERGAFTGPRSSNSQDGNIKGALAFTNAGLGVLTTGKIWYVDSGEGTGTENGFGWLTATDTINEAIDLCDADGGDDRGDYVVMAPGHAETLGTIDADVNGITILGFGRGTSKPTITYDTSTDVFIIGAPNVRVENLRFVTSVTGVVSGIEVETAGKYAEIINCDFGYAETVGTDEFLSAVSIAANADDALIKDNWFNAEEAGAAQAISMRNVSGIIIEDNTILGDYSVAGIKQSEAYGTPVASWEVFIRDNDIIIGELKSDGGLDIAQPAIELSEGTSGYIARNYIASDVATALLMIVADDCIRMSNTIIDNDGDEFTGAPEWYIPTTMLGSEQTHQATSVSGHVDG